MPAPETWRCWSAEVTNRLATILPTMPDEEEIEWEAVAWRGQPTARLRCEPDGRLVLIGVALSAWQGINLPRQWDDPARPPDPDPTPALVDFLSRVRQALAAWEQALPRLQV